ncbi:MAG: InlB B-repeat-containing protein [Bacilli bacterium]|nr:InlB B-repeat-containing protein [Bacilli bacterium]
MKVKGLNIIKTGILIVLCSFVLFFNFNLKALTGEGDITYQGGYNNTNQIDPFKGNDGANISGSKEATTLVDDKSNITFSFPAANYKEEYDLVLVVDGTNSFVPLAENVNDFLNDMATNLASRSNVKLNVGIVSYGTVSYDTWSNGTGLAWMMFSNCIKNGSCSGVSAMLPSEYQPLINNLRPIPTFPTSMNGPHSEMYRYLLGSSSGLVELSSSTNPTDPTSAPYLYNEIMSNGSDYAITALLTYVDVVCDITCSGQEATLKSTLNYQMGASVIGTNLEAGVKAGKEMLATGDADNENKFLVVITDGGTYYWNASGSDDAQQSLSQGLWNGFAQWGNGNANDFNKTNPAFLDYSGFKDFMDNSGVKSDTSSQMTIAEYQAWRNNNSLNYSSFLASNVNSAAYPFFALEKGIAHATMQFDDYIDNEAGRLVVLGTLYNASWHPPGSNVYALTDGFRDYLASLSDSYYTINDSTQSADIGDAFDSIVNQLFYMINKGTLVDTIGKEFDVVLNSSTLNVNDIRISLDGTDLTSAIDSSNQNQINYGTIGSDGLYPYVVTYTPGTSEKITLQINVPIDTSQQLKMHYQVKLNRNNSSEGWHKDVKLNESAIIDYQNSDNEPGKANFPIPLTKYYIPYHYQITYEANGGKGTLTDNNSPYLENSSVIVLSNKDQITRDGYTFIGWNTKSNGKGITYQANQEFIIENNMTLYAMWQKNKAGEDNKEIDNKNKDKKKFPPSGNEYLVYSIGLGIISMMGLVILKKE